MTILLLCVVVVAGLLSFGILIWMVLQQWR